LAASLPTANPRIGWSDRWTFRQFSFPAVMVTDTAPYRCSHHHLPSDTPDKVDDEKLGEGIGRVVREIAS
jgi:hypothetical protein